MNLFIGTGEQFLESLGFPLPEADFNSFMKLNSGFSIFKPEWLFSSHALFFIIHEGREIRAVLKTQPSSLRSEKFPFIGINFCEVKESFQGQGLARELYEAMFKQFAGGFVIGTDYESKESESKLKKLSFRLAQENKVYFLTRQMALQYSSEAEFPSTREELYSTYLKA